MTKRDFIAFARMISDMRKFDSIKFTPAQLDVLAERVADVCASQSTGHGFRRDTFLAACGVE